jgi:hypothetical protein
MLVLRPAAERGVTRIDWLDSQHTFSFAEYRDPQWMGFRERGASSLNQPSRRDSDVLRLAFRETVPFRLADDERRDSVPN